MRRKCFFLLIIILIVLYAADFLGIPMAAGTEEALLYRSIEFTGKVVGLQDKGEYLRLTVKLEGAEDRKLRAGERVLLNYYGSEEKPWELLNCHISFTAKLELPAERRNPRCFDYAGYLKSRGIGAVAGVKEIRREERSFTLREKYERKLWEKKYLFCRSLPESSKGIIMGVLFGDTAFLDEEVYDGFRANGTAHILAVSGLHVGLLYRIYQRLTGKKNNIPALAALVFVLYSYGELSGWSPSVSRAVIMISLSVTAKAADLRYDTLTAMSVAALILIANNPYVILGTGFQMSFLAIVSITFIRPLMPMRIPETAAVMLSVYIGLLPYQIYQFNYISLTSLIANIPIVCLAGYFLPVALLGFAAYALLGDMGPTVEITDAMGRLVCFVNDVSSLGGKGGFDVVSPPVSVLLALTLLMFFLSSEAFEIMKLRRRRRGVAACCALILSVALLFQLSVYSPISGDDIVFVDVGQGDCIHIRSGRTDVLIDGGGSVNYNLGKKTLKPYLLKNGAWNVDLAIATHEHTDHIKGLNELCSVYPVKRMMTGLTAGTVIDVSKDVKIETLWPSEIPEEVGQEDNSMCSVFMVFYKEYKILVTGDLDEKGEKMMLAMYEGTDMLKADVLKIGHHGSSSSTSDAFLEVVRPTYAVIQTGKNNYGHPSPKIIEKCAKKGIIVYRNDYNGAVGFCFDKNGIKCHTVLKNGE